MWHVTKILQNMSIMRFFNKKKSLFKDTNASEWKNDFYTFRSISTKIKINSKMPITKTCQNSWNYLINYTQQILQEQHLTKTSGNPNRRCISFICELISHFQCLMTNGYNFNNKRKAFVRFVDEQKKKNQFSHFLFSLSAMPEQKMIFFINVIPFTAMK